MQGMPGWMKWTIALLIGFGIIIIGFRFAGWLLTAFFVMNCLVLIIVVLLQSGKAADLAGAFGGAGSQTAFGPRGAATFLSRATTWCAIVFMMTSLTLSVKRSPDELPSTGSILEQTQKNQGNSTTKPTTPVTIPVQPAPAQNAPAQTTPAPAPAQSAPPK